MHPDIHLQLHRLDAAELRWAAAHTLPRTPLRTHVGWALVTLGLRLAVPATARPRPLVA
ncbi:hypothetical protein ACF05T_19235 [Streptomyces lateritius]|uniref:Uncharacterized protein n=1 Tax=Streptomyces lateritius TaxID=67313 RepID=A0ABW6YEH8_9ACTN|nr:hypothetical protein GCM10010272_39730 [Streptomyces lateritius]